MTTYLSTPKGDINIRIATTEDADSLFKLRLEALVAHPEAFAADVEMTQARGVRAWEDQIANDARNQSGVIVIASAGNELIGMTGIGRGHWPKTRHSGEVWGVYVDPNWRGLHIAQAILDECISWAQEQGMIILKLGVVTTNEVAIRCYQRSGFKVCGTEPMSNSLNGVYYDEYLMARQI